MLHSVTLVAIHSHGSIPLVVPGLCDIWTVGRYLVIVGPQTMSVDNICVCLSTRTANSEKKIEIYKAPSACNELINYYCFFNLIKAFESLKANVNK